MYNYCVLVFCRDGLDLATIFLDDSTSLTSSCQQQRRLGQFRQLRLTPPLGHSATGIPNQTWTILSFVFICLTFFSKK